MGLNKLLEFEVKVRYVPVGKFWALVDAQDYEKVCQYKWWMNKKGYAISFYGEKGQRKVLTMHRLLKDNPIGFSIDHVNKNKLDNRQENLRICTIQQNSFNTKKRITEKSTSIYKGVKGRNGRWLASIQYSGVEYWIGTFNTEIDAALAYDLYAREKFGNFAYLNFPDKIEYGVLQRKITR